MNDDDATSSTDVRKPQSAKLGKRTNKPLMEKRRRARINNCLTQLKTMLLQAMKKDGAHFSKLEKADILEMTVDHLNNLQKSQPPTTEAPEEECIDGNYRKGYSQCMKEVLQFLEKDKSLNELSRTGLLDHFSQVESDSITDDNVQAQLTTEKAETSQQLSPSNAEVQSGQQVKETTPSAESTSQSYQLAAPPCGIQVPFSAEQTNRTSSFSLAPMCTQSIQVVQGAVTPGQFALFLASNPAAGGIPTIFAAPVSTLCVDNNNNRTVSTSNGSARTVQMIPMEPDEAEPFAENRNTSSVTVSAGTVSQNPLAARTVWRPF